MNLSFPGRVGAYSTNAWGADASPAEWGLYGDQRYPDELPYGSGSHNVGQANMGSSPGRRGEQALFVGATMQSAHGTPAQDAALSASAPDETC